MIDFSPVVREGLQAILTKDERIKVIGDVPDEHESLQHIKRASDRGRPVKVVLIESRSGKVDGVQVTRIIKQQFPEVAVLVLTENINDSYVIDAIHAGAAGYIFLKDMSPEMLLQARSRTHAAIIAAQAGIVGNPINGIASVLEAQSEPGFSCLRVRSR